MSVRPEDQATTTIRERLTAMGLPAADHEVDGLLTMHAVFAASLEHLREVSAANDEEPAQIFATYTRSTPRTS
ncbi:MAG: hypothetical protein JWO57_2661 [Pseudonocardiales bacterium]|nr:hypothetical protein [Pseudonocardiales bacterium]